MSGFETDDYGGVYNDALGDFEEPYYEPEGVADVLASTPPEELEEYWRGKEEQAIAAEQVESAVLEQEGAEHIAERARQLGRTADPGEVLGILSPFAEATATTLRANGWSDDRIAAHFDENASAVVDAAIEANHWLRLSAEARQRCASHGRSSSMRAAFESSQRSSSRTGTKRRRPRLICTPRCARPGTPASRWRWARDRPRRRTSRRQPRRKGPRPSRRAG